MATSSQLPGGAPPPASPSGISATAPPNAISFALDKVGPPSPLYMQRDDVLVLQGASFTVDTITFNIRLLLAGGTIVPVQKTLALPATMVLQTLVVSLAEGFLLSVSASTTNTADRGTTYARAFVNRGAFGSGQPGLVLFGDYATNNLNVSWPPGRILQSSESSGLPLQTFANDPAAGANWNLATASTQRWRIQSVNAVFSASAAVANRIARLFVDSGGAKMGFFPLNAVITAGQTVQCTWAPGIIPVTTDPAVLMGTLPNNLQIENGQDIGTNTTNIQAGDQWSAIRVLVEQWLILV